MRHLWQFFCYAKCIAPCGRSAENKMQSFSHIRCSTGKAARWQHPGSKSVNVFLPISSKTGKVMMPEPPNPTKSKSHETRRRYTALRLRQALNRLVTGTPQQGRPSRLTVAALARDARVSRNTNYAEHSEFLDELASEIGMGRQKSVCSKTRDGRAPTFDRAAPGAKAFARDRECRSAQAADRRREGSRPPGKAER